jgi:hypothetical protein
LSSYSIIPKSSYFSKLIFSSFLRTAEFLSYFLATKAFIENKKQSLAALDRNFIYSFGGLTSERVVDLDNPIYE